MLFGANSAHGSLHELRSFLGGERRELVALGGA